MRPTKAATRAPHCPSVQPLCSAHAPFGKCACMGALEYFPRPPSTIGHRLVDPGFSVDLGDWRPTPKQLTCPCHHHSSLHRHVSAAIRQVNSAGHDATRTSRGESNNFGCQTHRRDGWKVRGQAPGWNSLNSPPATGLFARARKQGAGSDH
jgi:hypothetical protein